MDDRIKVNIVLLKNYKGVSLPKYETSGSVGVDLSAGINEAIIIKPFERKLIPTGIKIELPDFVEAQVRPRSGLALKNGITVLNTPGTIDSDYRGEIKVILINLGNEDFIVDIGSRIAQLVIAKVNKADFVEVTDVSNTVRGEGGFGSTGL